MSRSRRSIKPSRSCRHVTMTRGALATSRCPYHALPRRSAIVPHGHFHPWRATDAVLGGPPGELETRIGRTTASDQ